MVINPKEYPNTHSQEWKDAMKRAEDHVCNEHYEDVANELDMKPSGDGKGWICPFCKHGKGTSGNGSKDGMNAVRIKQWGNKIGFCCQGSCKYSGDAIKLYADVRHITYPEAARHLVEKYASEYLPNHSASTTNATKTPSNIPDSSQTSEKAPRIDSLNSDSKEHILTENASQFVFFKFLTNDRGAYFAQCVENRRNFEDAMAYLRNREISEKTLDVYTIGYDPNMRRIIMPTDTGAYQARDIGNSNLRYKNPKDEEKGLFNGDTVLDDSQKPIFIVEGPFDALSILEVGGRAIALNGSTSPKDLIERIKYVDSKFEGTLILCLDNDDAGKRMQQKLKDALTENRIRFVIRDITGPYKDANEALVNDRTAFQSKVEESIKMADEVTKGAEEAARREAMADSLDSYLNSEMYGRDLNVFRGAMVEETGFNEWDNKSGGLFQGLYVLAGGTSIGKTTFAIQLAEQLAERGKKVMYFSLEQSKLEVLTKCISRKLKAELDKDVTALDIKCGELEEEDKAVVQEYSQTVLKNFLCIEGNFNYGVQEIKGKVHSFIDATGERPVVFVDYLQILQPPDDAKKTVREYITDCMTGLKVLTREEGIILFVISSVNRTNYYQQFDFSALKESGAIEYSADVVLGLQLGILNNTKFKKLKDNQTGANSEKRKMYKESKKESPRKIEMICLKDRNGESSYNCYFNYDTAHDTFLEETDPKAHWDGWDNEEEFDDDVLADGADEDGGSDYGID